MKKILLAAVLIGIMGAAPSAFAKMAYLKQLKTTYENYKPEGKAPGCNVCHIKEEMPHLNPYGADWEKNGRDYAKIENIDSDGDTVTNKAEIDANTYPGDKNSKP